MPEIEPQRIALLLSGDLMFASRVRGPAEAAGLNFEFSGGLPAAASLETTYVLLDLSTAGGKIHSLSERRAELFPRATLIAFGPHVDVSKLAAARAAGFDQVLTRSQLVQQLPGLFK